MVGVAGTFAGVALAVIRERVDRMSDLRAAKQAAEEQHASESGDDDTDRVTSGSRED